MAARGIASQRAVRPRTNLTVPKGGTPIVRSAPLDSKLKNVENHAKGPVGNSGKGGGGKATVRRAG